MNHRQVKQVVLCVVFFAAFSPVLAQDSNQEPQTTTTGEGQPVSQSQQAANESIKKSLGSIDETYRGKHKYFADDFMGNWFDGMAHGDPISLSVLGVIAAIAGGVWFKFGRKKAVSTGVRGAQRGE